VWSSLMVLWPTACLALVMLSGAALFARLVPSRPGSVGDPSPSHPSDAPAEQREVHGTLSIPAGTVLPVRLNQTLSSVKSSANQVLTARIMQDVPLFPGRIPAGTKIQGHIVEVIPAGQGVRARLSLEFDTLVVSHQALSVRTQLRAIAGFMQINEAQIPPIGPSESDVYRWLTRVQVGGDVVYGDGGIVTTANNPNDVVGMSVKGGVVGRLRAKEGAPCSGAGDGNDRPQALWVFSADACGVYGLEHIGITHAGRSDPVGVIVLTSDSDDLKIAAGAGMLLGVSANYPH